MVQSLYFSYPSIIKPYSPFFPTAITTTAMADKAARRAKFEQVYKRIADELVDELRKNNIPEDVMNWYRRVHLILFSHLTTSELMLYDDDGWCRAWITMYRAEN
jgi:hypothetical protein